MSRILLIEDIPDNAVLVQRVLDVHGYQVIWSETAEKGFSDVEPALADLVLVDLGLPDIDGQTLVGYLRNIPGMESVPIIAITAWAEETARQMVTAYGCNAYVSKPLDVRSFVSVVNHFCQERPAL